MRPPVATADLQVLGHILDTGCAHGTGRTVVWTSRLKEQVVLAVTCLLVSEQTNKQLLYSVRDTRRYLSGLVRPHCVALVAIYTNIQISVGWFFRKSSNDGHIYEGPVGNWHPPVDDVCQQVVVSEPVLCVDLLVVHRQRAVKDATFLRKRFHIVHMENEHLRIPRQDEP